MASHGIDSHGIASQGIDEWPRAIAAFLATKESGHSLPAMRSIEFVPWTNVTPETLLAEAGQP